MGFRQRSLLLSTGLPIEEIAEIMNEVRSGKSLEGSLRVRGEKYLHRYDIFKKYKELTFSEDLKAPIVVVLGAMPCAGKTTMALELSTAFGFGNVLGDSFRAALREFIPTELNPAFFTSVYESWKFFGDAETKDAIIRAYETQARIVNKGVHRVVADRGLRDGESMICEYLHFLPSYFSEDVLHHPSLVPIILRLDSEDEYRRRIGLRNKLTHLKGNSIRLFDAIPKYLVMQEYQCQDALKKDVPIVSADDWEVAFDKVMNIIFERIERLIHYRNLPEPEIVKRLVAERRRLQSSG